MRGVIVFSDVPLGDYRALLEGSDTSVAVVVQATGEQTVVIAG